jgi:hypothetical protein
MSSSNSDNLTAFPLYMSFSSFSCVNSLARTCSIMLNKNGDNEHSCLIQDIREKTFIFTPFNMLALGLLGKHLIMLHYVCCMINLISVFTIKGYWILSNAFSASIMMTIWFCPLFCWCHISHLLLCAYETLFASLRWLPIDCGEQCFLFAVASILLSIFASMFTRTLAYSFLFMLYPYLG